jgi:hypothetical protein
VSTLCKLYELVHRTQPCNRVYKNCKVVLLNKIAWLHEPPKTRSLSMPYSGNSTLAPVLRVTAVGMGVLWGSWKLSSLRAQKLRSERQKAKDRH